MRVRAVFRVDASVEMGSGHVMRCLTLAEGLKARGFDVCFISRSLPGNMNEYLTGRGWRIHALPYRPEICLSEGVLLHESWLGVCWETDSHETLAILSEQAKVDWLIVDHYALDGRWERTVRPAVGRMMVIDDLADRAHIADLLLDQTLHGNMEERYRDLAPDSCRLLLGPWYALLRKEFAEKRRKLRKRTGELRRVLVFFGGSDPCNVTERAVRAFGSMYHDDIAFDIVVGGSNPAKDQIRELCGQSPNFQYHCQVSDMAGLIEQADLAFGAAGSSVWERLCLGLPSVVVSMAENQDTLLRGIMDKEPLFYMGDAASIREEHFVQALNRMLGEEGKRSLLRMSDNAMDIVDGMGCERVVSAIVEFPTGLLG